MHLSAQGKVQDNLLPELQRCAQAELQKSEELRQGSPAEVCDQLQEVVPEGAPAAVSRHPAEGLQEDQHQEEPVCEEKTVPKVPQEHQDHSQGGHQEQLSGELIVCASKLPFKCKFILSFVAGCAPARVQNHLPQ